MYTLIWKLLSTSILWGTGNNLKMIAVSSGSHSYQDQTTAAWPQQYLQMHLWGLPIFIWERSQQRWPQGVSLNALNRRTFRLWHLVLTFAKCALFVSTAVKCVCWKRIDQGKGRDWWEIRKLLWEAVSSQCTIYSQIIICFRKKSGLIYENSWYVVSRNPIL